jgi:Domain of unknown function (DUF4878)
MMIQTKLKLLLLLTIAASLVGCGLFGSPSKAMKNFYYALEAGRLDDAMKMVSSQTKGSMGEQKLRAVLSDLTGKIKERGGIDSIEITNEEVTGQIADVSGTVTYGNGTSEAFTQKLFKEDGEWKVR